MSADRPLGEAEEGGVTAQRWAELLHVEHAREFEWMTGDALHAPMTVEECGNCQRWGRYAAAVWGRVLP